MFTKIIRGLRRSGTTRSRRAPRLCVQALEVRVVPSLDQIFDPEAVSGNNYFSTSVAYFAPQQEEAQTFTVGMSGTLTEVDLYIAKFSGSTGDLIVDIRGCQADGRPTSGAGQELLSVTVPAATIPGNPAHFFPVDVSAASLQVTPGEQLAVILHVATDPGADVTYWWGGRPGNNYAAGGFTDRVIGNYDWLAVSNDDDLGFKTYVNAAPNQPPAVTLPSGGSTYTEDNPPTVLDPNATVTDPDSPNFDTGTLDVSISANGTADDRLTIVDQGTGAGQIGISGGTVTYGGTAIGTFTGGIGTTDLVVTFNANATPAIAQALLRDIAFSNVAANPSAATRTIGVVVTDGAGGTSSAADTTVAFVLDNDPPVVTTNTGVTVLEGGAGVIAQSNLEATDPDNTPDQLTYTVSAGPAHGSLDVAGAPVTTFTQAQLNAGAVSYVNDGSVNTSDAFTFTVSDGLLATSSTTFNIIVTLVNNPPTLMTNAGLIVAKGASATIGHAVLDTADPDNTSSQLIYTVSAGPSHGSLKKGGQAVTSFSQADIDAGRVSYANDGSAATGDAFTFAVSDGTVSTTPATFDIAVDTVPLVALSPVSKSAFAGSPVTLTAAASGTPAPTVRWQVKTPAGSFTDIPGATSTSYTFVPTASANGNQYQTVFTNPVGSAMSSAATLTITPGLVILSSPVSQTVALGQTATFSASATGSTRTAVQWQVSTDGGATYTNIAGATKATLNVMKSSAALDGALYRAMFRNAAGQAPTVPASLTINYTVTLGGKHAIAVRPGTMVTLAVQAKAVPTSVQWQVSTDMGHTWTDIAGATGNTYAFVAGASDSGHMFRANVTSGNKTSASASATLTAIDPPSIATSPTDQSVTAGQAATFTASAAPLSAAVQWQVSTDGGLTFTNIRGATKGMLTLKKVKSSMSGYVFRAAFTDPAGVTESTTATVTVT